MTTSSEDVLLSVSHVRYKKGDGTLYVMNQRLAWMLENKDTVAVSHKYADIKTQKISPAGKSKVQLQAVLHDGTCSTFHFVNPAGQEAQAKDRDQVKQLLQELLPKFQRQIDGELEMKSKLLSLHPTLKRLYEDLVISQVISSDVYWNTPTLKQFTETTNVKQDTGVSGAFLADIQPQTDGCNGLKYNLTQDIMDAIFKTYPAVRKKHMDYVPKKMTEAEFWTKFFQSHYFHRDRIASKSSKDLFGECAKMDDHAISSAMKHTSLDLTVDLPQFVELVPILPPEQEKPNVKDRGDNMSIHRNMIKRFNQHSIMVLKASQKTNSSNKNSNINTNSSSSCNNTESSNCNSNSIPKSSSNPSSNGNGSGNSSNTNGNGDSKLTNSYSNHISPYSGSDSNNLSSNDSSKHDKPPRKKSTMNGQISKKRQYEETFVEEKPEKLESPLEKKKKVLEKVKFEDLEPLNGNKEVLHLTLSKVERYLHGPSSKLDKAPVYDSNAPCAALASICQAWSSGQQCHRPVKLGPATAVGALGELSPGGALMRQHHAASMAQLVPADAKAELQRLYLSCAELLRELWKCFPQPGSVADTEEAVANAAKFYAALLRFKTMKLRPFESKMLRDLTPLATSLTRHLNQMIETACTKYVIWNDRRVKLR